VAAESWLTVSRVTVASSSSLRSIFATKFSWRLRPWLLRGRRAAGHQETTMCTVCQWAGMLAACCLRAALKVCGAAAWRRGGARRSHLRCRSPAAARCSAGATPPSAAWGS